MGIGIGLGGFAEGMQAQDKINIAEKAQEQAIKNKQVSDADTQIATTMKTIGDIAKAASDAGHDPKTILSNGAVQSLLQSAQSLAARVGRDPNQLAQMVQTMALRPPKTGQPIQDAVPPQPVLSPSEVITPPQASRVNPPGTVPQVAPVAPVAPTTPAPGQPDTPVSPVAMRFPTPDQGTAPAVPAPPVPTLPPGMQPGQAAVDFAIKNNVVGKPFLEALPPMVRNNVVDVANYKIPLETASKRRDGQTALASYVHQYTNGEYDARYYKPMQAAIKEFTTGGQTSPAGQITVGNTAIAHGSQVADAIDKLSAVPGLLDKIAKSNTPMVSYAANALKNKALIGTSEGQALSAFLTASHHFVDETTKFYAGGQPAEAGRERGLSNFDAAKSPAELYQALNSEAELLHGKVNALQDRWKNALAGPKMGDILFRNAIPDFPVLSEASRTALDRIGQGYLATKFKGNVPGAQPGNVVDFRTYFGGQ